MDTLRLKAPGSWINDPNGFIYYKGKYHLFYQYFPYATRWGTMHWGHAVSKDLIHWDHLGVALFPTKRFDQNGIFSGGAIEKDGDLVLYYSGVKYYASEPDNSHAPLNDTYECAQVMIKSEDGMTFDNYDGKKEIIPVIYDDEIANFNHTRDPKVWKENDTYYMVLGSTYKKEMGRLLVYKSDDAEHWELQTVLADEKFGKILECPDLFKIGDQNILVISPMYIVPESEGYEAQTMVGTVDFDPDTCEVSNLRKFNFVDHGREFYATQSCLDEEGRRVLIGWIRMPKEMKNPWDKKAWNGMMSLPRVVELHNDGIYTSIHPNVRKFFDKKLTGDEIISFQANQRVPFLIKSTLKNGDKLNLGGYRIWMEDDMLHTDRSAVMCESKLKNEFTIPAYGNTFELEIVAEANCIEIYVNNGKYVLTNVVYGLKEEIDGIIDEMYIPSEEIR